MWGMPPAQRGEFVAQREDVLQVDQQPDDPQVPLVGMDEQPVPLTKEIRTPLPAEAGKPARYDDASARTGTATIFMFTEPLRGRRLVRVREPKTAVAWATEVQQRLDCQYPEADRLRLVCDHLNTPRVGSF